MIGKVLHNPMEARKIYFQTMLGQEWQGNEATNYGVEAEPLAADWYAAETGAVLEEVGLVVHPEHERYAASPDRVVVGQNKLLEIKCPYSRDLPVAPYPDHVEQVQWQMYCTGTGRADLVYWTPDDGRIFEIERDETLIGSMAYAARSFLEDVDSIPDPAAWLESPVQQRDDPEWVSMADMLRKASQRLSAAQETYDLLKEKLLMLAGDKDCQGGGVRVTSVTRKGQVDWRKVQVDYGVDIDKYRKEDITYRQVTISGS